MVMPTTEFIPSPPGGGCPEGAGEGTSLTTLIPTLARRLASALDIARREARLEAQILVAHALGVERAWLIAHDRDMLSPVQCNAIDILITRRELGEPVAYILGDREFYGRTFKVTPDVLIPRPETELLIEAVLERLSQYRPATVLDLGTGSGCIALTLALERPACQVWAVDRSEAALAVAHANAKRLGVDGLRFLTSDWYAALGAKSFDLIVANPPYVDADDPHLRHGDVRFEPVSALAAGVRGLDNLRPIITAAPIHLFPGGWLMVEHGWDQGATCHELFTRHGFSEVQTLRDPAGQERITVGRLLARPRLSFSA